MNLTIPDELLEKNQLSSSVGWIDLRKPSILLVFIELRFSQPDKPPTNCQQV